MINNYEWDYTLKKWIQKHPSHCPNCGKSEWYQYSFKIEGHIECLLCNWKGQVTDLLSDSEIINKKRTELIDKMLC